MGFNRVSCAKLLKILNDVSMLQVCFRLVSIVFFRLTWWFFLLTACILHILQLVYMIFSRCLIYFSHVVLIPFPPLDTFLIFGNYLYLFICSFSTISDWAFN